MISPEMARQLNALILLGISGILTFALVDQFALGDLPCPLCLLQRVGFVLAGFGFALNILFGPQPSHYGVAILGACVGAGVATRQILLHIVPGSGTYGDALFGLHFYTWALIAFCLIILACALLLLFEDQFRPTPGMAKRVGWRGATGLGIVALFCFSLLTLINAGSTFAECELGLCPDNPESYELLDEEQGEQGEQAGD